MGATRGARVAAAHLSGLWVPGVKWDALLVDTDDWLLSERARVVNGLASELR